MTVAGSPERSKLSASSSLTSDRSFTGTNDRASVLADRRMRERVLLHPGAVRAPWPRELDPEELVPRPGFFQGLRRSRSATRSARARRPRRARRRRGIAGHADRYQDKSEHRPGPGAREDSEESSCISLNRGQSRVVVIECASENWTHSIRGDATLTIERCHAIGEREDRMVQPSYRRDRRDSSAVLGESLARRFGRPAVRRCATGRIPGDRQPRCESARRSGPSIGVTPAEGDRWLEDLVQQDDLAESAGRGQQLRISTPVSVAGCPGCSPVDAGCRPCTPGRGARQRA